MLIPPHPSATPLSAPPSPGKALRVTDPTIPELIDKCVGSRIWVVMKGDKGTLLFSLPPLPPSMPNGPCPRRVDGRMDGWIDANVVRHPEFSGTLLGFDDYVSKFSSSLSPTPALLQTPCRALESGWARAVLTIDSRYGVRRRDGIVRDFACPPLLPWP